MKLLTKLRPKQAISLREKKGTIQYGYRHRELM